jgi:hypothetical protein
MQFMRDEADRATKSQVEKTKAQAAAFEARANNADLVLKDRLRQSRRGVEATLQTTPEQREDILKRAIAYLSNFGVVVAERATNRDPEQISADQVLSLAESGRKLFEASKGSGADKNDLLMFESKLTDGAMYVRARDLASFGRKARYEQSEDSGATNANVQYLRDFSTGMAALVASGHVSGMPRGFNEGQIPKDLPLPQPARDGTPMTYGRLRESIEWKAKKRAAEYPDGRLSEFSTDPSREGHAARVGMDQLRTDDPGGMEEILPQDFEAVYSRNDPMSPSERRTYSDLGSAVARAAYVKQLEAKNGPKWAEAFNAYEPPKKTVKRINRERVEGETRTDVVPSEVESERVDVAKGHIIENRARPGNRGPLTAPKAQLEAESLANVRAALEEKRAKFIKGGATETGPRITAIDAELARLDEQEGRRQKPAAGPLEVMNPAPDTRKRTEAEQAHTAAAPKEGAAPVGKTSARPSGAAGHETDSEFEARIEKRIVELNNTMAEAANDGSLNATHFDEILELCGQGKQRALANKDLEAVQKVEQALKLLGGMRDGIAKILSGAWNVKGATQDTVDAWSRRFAKGEKVQIVSLPVDHPYTTELRRDLDLGGVQMMLGGRQFIGMVEGKNSAKTTGSALGRLAHEFGHALQRIAFDKAAPKVKAAIEAAYNEDIQDLKFYSGLQPFISSARLSAAAPQMETAKGPTLLAAVDAVEQVFDGARQSSSKHLEYLTSFPEWFAEQFSKYVTSSEDLKLPTHVRGFWTQLIKKVQEFFDVVVRNMKPDTTFAQWANSLEKADLAASGGKRKLNAQATQLHNELGRMGFGATHDSPIRHEGKFDWRKHALKGEGESAFGAGTYLSTGDVVHRYYKKMFTARVHAEAKRALKSDPVYAALNNELNALYKSGLVPAEKISAITSKLFAMEDAAVGDAKNDPTFIAMREKHNELRNRHLALGRDNAAGKAQLSSQIQKLGEEMNTYAESKVRKSPTYQVSVDIPPERLLDWDKPLSRAERDGAAAGTESDQGQQDRPAAADRRRRQRP